MTALSVGQAVGLGLPLLAGIELLQVPFWVRLSTLHVEVRDDGVRVKNPFSTRLYRWTDIQAFGLFQRGLRIRCGYVDLRTGERVSLWSIEGPNPGLFPNVDTVERQIATLNDCLAQQTKDGESSEVGSE